ISTSSQCDETSSFFVGLFFFVNLLTGLLKERVELLCGHSAFPKTFANRRKDLSKALLRKKLGLDQGPEILLSALSFALAQLSDGFSGSFWESSNLDCLGLRAHKTIFSGKFVS